jgi:hypothetical protein
MTLRNEVVRNVDNFDMSFVSQGCGWEPLPLKCLPSFKKCAEVSEVAEARQWL